MGVINWVDHAVGRTFMQSIVRPHKSDECAGRGLEY